MVAYKCWAGYRLEPPGSSTRYCNGGKWSGENPKCGKAPFTSRSLSICISIVHNCSSCKLHTPAQHYAWLLYFAGHSKPRLPAGKYSSLSLRQWLPVEWSFGCDMFRCRVDPQRDSLLQHRASAEWWVQLTLPTLGSVRCPTRRALESLKYREERSVRIALTIGSRFYIHKPAAPGQIYARIEWEKEISLTPGSRRRSE